MLMTHRSATSLVIGLLMFLSGCAQSSFPGCILSDDGQSAAEAVAAKSARALFKETDILWRSSHKEERTILPRDYPGSVLALKPSSVRVAPEGVYISIYSCFVTQEGIFIRHDPSFEPPQTGDPGFSSIDGNVYWFDAPG